MTVVVKLGGELLLPGRESELVNIVDALRAWIKREPMAIVHGGGPQTSGLMRRLGLEPKMVAGQRVTDAAALEAMVMAVGGWVNARLTATLVNSGVLAVGLSGVSKGCIQCVRRPARQPHAAGDAPVDYGLVGDVTFVDASFFRGMMGAGMVPVVACVGLGPGGELLNVNADTVATEIALALEAESLVLLTATNGVREDKDDPESRIPRLDRVSAERAMREGKVAGGMIAKLEEAFRAVEGGVEHVHVLGQLGPGDLERALEKPGSVGTVLTA